MRDRGLIVAGLVVFLVLVTLPVWYNAAFGTPRRELQLAKPRGDRCVLPRADIRKEHMELLIDWRTRVVRDQERRLTLADGRRVDMSLTGTCLGCHGVKADFCDRCHQYAGVSPTCWNCHVDPPRPPGAATAGRSGT